VWTNQIIFHTFQEKSRGLLNVIIDSCTQTLLMTAFSMQVWRDEDFIEFQDSTRCSLLLSLFCHFKMCNQDFTHYNLLAGTREQFTTQQKCHACFHARKQRNLKVVCFLKQMRLLFGWKRLLTTILSVLIHCLAKDAMFWKPTLICIRVEISHTSIDMARCLLAERNVELFRKFSTVDLFDLKPN